LIDNVFLSSLNALQSIILMDIKVVNMFNVKRSVVLISVLLLGHTIAHADTVTGDYRLMGNMSTLSTSITSINQDLTIHVKPIDMAGQFDFLFSTVTEPSFHSDDESIINEHAIEGMISYRHPFGEQIHAIGGVFFNRNRTITEHYMWAVLGADYDFDLSDDWSVDTTFMAKKNIQHGRVFYDLESELAYQILPTLELAIHAHRFEELGEFDDTPAIQSEYGADMAYHIDDTFETALSYERHTEDDDHEGRWAILSLSLSTHF
jgi:hypothetical protein